MSSQASNNTHLISNAKLSSALDACVHGIIVVDSSCQVTAWSQWMNENSLIHQKQAIGQHLFSLFPSLQGKRIELAIKHALQQGNAAILSHALNRHPFPLHTNEDQDEPIKQTISVKPIGNASEDRMCIIQIQDVTPSVRREKLLRDIANQAEEAKYVAEQASQTKTEFISTVSHELRTPLTSILGSLGLICGDTSLNLPKQAALLTNLAYRNSQHLLELINDLLDIEKIESGKMDFTFKRLDVSALIEESIQTNSGLASKYNVCFKITSNPQGICVDGDNSRLTQVMSNLLSNAAKFSPLDSAIKISVTPSDNKVRISVADQGAGIPEEFQPILFEKFTQSDSAGKVGGTGLGLSIAKSIIESHGGQIKFDTAADTGTIFHIDLPILSTTPARAI